MKYNFKDEVRRALAGARMEAVEWRHEYVGTEHILAGLLRDPPTRAAAVLRELGVREQAVRQQLSAAVLPGRSTVGVAELPYTSRAKKTLEFAMAEARQQRQREIGTEHLLIALLREEKGIGAAVLSEVGVTLERVRDAVGGVSSAPSQPVGTTSFEIHLDDASDRSIYEQIVARVQEAVATGDLGPGFRLPSVRQLADQLDIAPGTVARAYSELERLGVVVTEGARGTRVADPAAAAQGPQNVPGTLAGLLRPAAVAAFHMGADAADMRRALEEAMKGILAE